MGYAKHSKDKRITYGGVQQKPNQNIRRSQYLFFHIRDSEIQSADNKILAISLLNGIQYYLNIDVLKILLDISTDRWTPISQVTKKKNGRTDFNIIQDLIDSGMLLIDKTDNKDFIRLKKKDEQLTANRWNPYAALYYFMCKRSNERSVFMVRDSEFIKKIFEPLTQKGSSTKVVEITASDYLDLDSEDIKVTLETIKRNREELFKQTIELNGMPLNAYYTCTNSLETKRLPRTEQKGHFFDLLLKRKTTRLFDKDSPMRLKDLSTILYHVYGTHGSLRMYRDIKSLKKTSPSAGATHPIEVYPLIINVKGLKSGLYHYNVKNHSLEMIVKTDTKKQAADLAEQFTAYQPYFKWSQAIFLMVARFYRNFWKYPYDVNSYGLILMDAGHLGQTFYLVCTELGLGAFFTPAINSVQIEAILGLDPVNEGAIAISGCGKPLSKESDFAYDVLGR